jgi:phosphoglycolate phosphatase
MNNSALAVARSIHRPMVLRAGVRGPQVVLCDLDGTLIDTMPILAELAATVMADAYGMSRKLAKQRYLDTCGLPFCQQVDLIHPGDPRNAETVARFEMAKPALCRSARMAPETRHALGALRERGLRVVVSSNNGEDNVRAFAQNASFAFDLVLGFGEGLAKGGPHIAYAERTFGMRRDQMVFVGDSLHDGEIAARERIPFIGVAGTFAQEHFAERFPAQPVVRRFSDIVGVLN